MSTFSAVVNGQLIPVAPANAVVAPPAPQPMISGGAYASNLPGMSLMGGATNMAVPQVAAVTNASPTTSTVSTSAAQNGGVPNVSSVTGNVWNLPFWKNPLALTIILLVVAYLILRFIHWNHG